MPWVWPEQIRVHRRDKQSADTYWWAALLQGRDWLAQRQQCFCLCANWRSITINLQEADQYVRHGQALKCIQMNARSISPISDERDRWPHTSSIWRRGAKLHIWGDSGSHGEQFKWQMPPLILCTGPFKIPPTDQFVSELLVKQSASLCWGPLGLQTVLPEWPLNHM